MLEAWSGTMLKKLAAACAALTLTLGMVPATAQDAARQRVGTLTCIEEMHTGYMNGPKPMTFMYQGQASPR
jgi:hypothetical protein